MVVKLYKRETPIKKRLLFMDYGNIVRIRRAYLEKQGWYDEEHVQKLVYFLRKWKIKELWYIANYKREEL